MSDDGPVVDHTRIDRALKAVSGDVIVSLLAQTGHFGTEHGSEAVRN